MKLASIRYGDQNLVAAQLDEGRVVDIAELARLADAGGSAAAPLRDMLDVISVPPARLGALAAALALARAEPSRVEALPADALTWRPPVPRPGKICAVAMNNSASNERKISAPDHPAFFLKPSSCLVGHREPIRVRRYYGSVHPEPELAVVIGARTRDVDSETALDTVFGYTIFDDITSNGMRAEDRFHYYAIYASEQDPTKTERVEQHLSYAGRYKGSDTFGAMGPWLVTSDEIRDPDELTVVCKAGGETIAEDSTRYYNYKVAQVVSFISQFLTLEPGDVISMGTAFKPGARRKSIHHANLQHTPGPIEISIEGLGTLSNPVVVDERPLGRWR
jgi:2-keto-4-pentenoate hydratase/2-oxohepta-3-ene-1,7-dioic acid hydratase in catechol pathway